MGFLGISLVLIGAIVFIILSTSIFKLHPFISLILVSIFTGFALGIGPTELIRIIGSGFGGILAYIGLVIVLGSVLGDLLEKSGGAELLAQSILKTIGKKNPQLALSALGAIVGIPVFCDTGFIILSRLTDSIAQSRNISAKKLSVGLAAGLYTTHTLVPPTPGPIAAAGNLGAGDYLGLVMLLGFAISVPVIIIAYLAARRMKFYSEPERQESKTKDSFKIHLEAWRAYLPILLPIILIGAGTSVRLLGINSVPGNIITFIGDPVIALLITIGLSYRLLKIPTSKEFGESVSRGISQAGPVLIITGAGGAFGAVLKASPLTENLEGIFSGIQGNLVLLILISFSLAAILKTSQGSSTSAIVIASSMLAPVLPAFGITDPLEVSLMVMAVGGGAMTVSHANDSYFWVVSQFGGLTVKEAYRSYTIITALQGLTVLVITLLMAAFS